MKPALFVAALCSFALTTLTVSAPTIATDWARLDANGIYIPHAIPFAWPSYALQVGLWVTMVGALWWACKRRQRLKPPAAEKPSPLKGLNTKANLGTGSVYIGLALLTLLGFGLRVHSLTALPLIIDEIGFAAQASDILHGQHVPIFAPGHNANPSVYSWLVAVMVALFGQNTFAIRLTPLFFGTLSIPAVYVLGREWWSRRVGLVAAAFLATYPAHIFYSRMSLYNIVDPVFAMLTLAFLARALRRGERWDFVLAGMMAACAQYFYHGSRLVLVLAIGNWLLARRSYGLNRQAAKKRQETIGLLQMGLAFGLLALPRFAPALVGQLPLEGNREAMRLPADFIPENTVRAVRAWVGQPDVSPFWLSDAPLLLWPALVLAVIGLVYSVRLWRDARHEVLLAWVVLTTIFGGAIWTATPLYVRYMTAAPAIALVVALGLSAFSGQLSARTFHYLSIGMILFICIYGVIASWQHSQEALARITESHWMEADLARQAASLPEDTSVVLVVPREFSDLETITIADYVAAFGVRRALAVNREQSDILQRQIDGLPQPVEIVRDDD